ncbi:MAG TPA: L-threonylcarbamoyladenylate synthase [Oligoflexia bacterium]|nr:L-threonylcarbamoyladenylate synthase [Oligoflexia bacterium]HMR24258.1 L-threonylcarbamoyladenylate synthase [Oligoflexia bacterium]
MTHNITNIDHNIEQALLAFKQKKLVAIPTETVYGLAAPINNEALIHKIFSLKERPFFDPLIIHVASIEQAKSLTTQWTETAQMIAHTFWPGPLTIILPKKEHVSDMITAGLPTVGIRFPKHPLTQKLIKSLGVPLAAPSANKFKQTSPTQVEHVKKAFLEQDVYILDGGPCTVGIESTIVDLSQTPIKILRPGMLNKKDFAAIGIDCTEIKHTSSIEAPGMMEDHYMPSKPLFLTSTFDLSIVTNFLNTKKIKRYAELKLPDDPIMAARKLYSLLHQDIHQDSFVCHIKSSWQKDPQWFGILDRLKKASSAIID